MPSITLDEIREVAKSLQLELVSVSAPDVMGESLSRLEEWQRSGFAAEMGYMLHDAVRMCDPRTLLPEARSILVFGVEYDRGSKPALKPGQGRVARYAWGRDYHRVLKKRLQRLVKEVQNRFLEPIRSRIFSDAVPMLERALGQRAGLGFFGKNTLLIHPKLGSFFFLAELMWDVEVRHAKLPIVSGTCGSCVRCSQSCPTAALVGDFQLDARRCISYLTIEKRGALSEWERQAIGEWLFGCDICQEVCPFNHTALKAGRRAALPEFEQANGVGPLLELAQLLQLRSEDAFRRRFAGTALMRAGRQGLLRNAAVVAANTGAESVVDELIVSAAQDESELVRQHAVWALWKLSLTCNIGVGRRIGSALAKARRDPAACVSAEAEHILERAS